MNKLCTGVFSPITTTFDADGTLNLKALKENVLKYAKTPLAGYLALGSNGENKSLTWDEKIEVARVIIENKAPEQTRPMPKNRTRAVRKMRWASARWPRAT